MKFHKLLLASLLSAPALAAPPSFETLVCINVIGPSMQVQTNADAVEVHINSQRSSQSSKLVFDTSACDFAPGYSVDFTCDNNSHRLKVVREQRKSPQGSIYSDLTVVIEDLITGTKQVESFSTRRVQSGKVASCIINGGFEIK